MDTASTFTIAYSFRGSDIAADPGYVLRTLRGAAILEGQDMALGPVSVELAGDGNEVPARSSSGPSRDGDLAVEVRVPDSGNRFEDVAAATRLLSAGLSALNGHGVDAVAWAG